MKNVNKKIICIVIALFAFVGITNAEVSKKYLSDYDNYLICSTIEDADYFNCVYHGEVFENNQSIIVVDASSNVAVLKTTVTSIKPAFDSYEGYSESEIETLKSMYNVTFHGFDNTSIPSGSTLSTAFYVVKESDMDVKPELIIDENIDDVIRLEIKTKPIEEKQPEEIEVDSILNVGERTADNNYGVNKKWKINDSNMGNVLRTPLVDSSKKIYDFSDVLTDTEEEELRIMAEEFQERFKTELVIITYNLPYYADEENEDFAADFYDYNDFGMDYELYDGIVLFRNTYDEDPYYDMYTFGEAQLYFNQARYDAILDDIYNDLHSENYLEGFASFISLVTTKYESGKPSSMKDYALNKNGIIYNTKTHKLDANGNIVKKYNPPILLGLIIAAAVSAITVGIMIKKNKMVRKATAAGVYLDKSSIDYTVMRDIYRGSHVSSYTVNTSSGGSSGGGHVGSSGGGHSSGGGRHG